MRYIDIGVNLFCRQFPQPERILMDAALQGVSCILTGSDAEENRRVADFVAELPKTSNDVRIWGTCGIHPHNADRLKEGDLAFIREAQALPGIVAVGECGLDYDRMFSTRENQLHCLEAHIDIAEETGKPMFLHERRAHDDLVHVFRRHPSLCSRCVVHCFTGTLREMDIYLNMGFMIGITGWVCDDRRAGELREAVSILPLDRVMLETDAPYLTPRNIPGLDRTNVPGNIRYVARTLAYYMHAEEEELRIRALENTKRFFCL